MRRAKKKKMYIVRHRILATSLMDARRQSKKQDPDEIYLDADWIENGSKHLTEAIGYHEIEDEEDYDEE